MDVVYDASKKTYVDVIGWMNQYLKQNSCIAVYCVCNY